MTSTEPAVAEALDLLPTLLADSPRLRAILEDRFADLMDTVFDKLEETLDVGGPKEQLDVLKMLLPLMVRVKKDNEVTGDGVEAARAELQEVLAEMGAGLGAVEEVGEIVEPEGVSI